MKSRSKRDWTCDKTGRSNSSDKFEELCLDVESMIKGGASSLLHGNAYVVARLIVAQLAHVHKLAPKR